MTSVSRFAFTRDIFQIGAVFGLTKTPRPSQYLLAADVATSIAYFFQTGHFQALAAFDGFYEIAGLQQRLVSAGIKPGYSSAENLQVQPFLAKIVVIDVGYFELAPCRRLQLTGYLRNPVVVKIEPHDCII